jgi:predicted dehydrogenase
MTTAPVNLGLIGLGPLWESQYRPALSKLNQRLKVVAVYDNVRSRAEQAARETHSHVMGGITLLVNRPDVQAVLWLDAGWQGPALMRLLCESRKPILNAAKCELSMSELQQVHEQAVANGQTIVPAFPKRCTPASIRLQELLATQLGRPQQIEINIAPASMTAVPFATSADFGGMTPPPEDPLLEWTDWVQYLFRAAPIQVTRHADGRQLRLDFVPLNPASNASDLRSANLSLNSTPPISDQPACDEVRLQCEQGRARIIGTSSIEWSNDRESHSEMLTTERTETEVLLDLFCRRVVGGLVPVPDLSDLIRTQRIVSLNQAEHSQ